jgi:RNA polymerase sigma-70 factor (ECF subfamily)
LFELAWASSLLDQAMSLLRDDMRAAGKEERFDCLRHLMTPGPDGMTTALAAERLAMSEGAIRVALHRMKRSYAEKLRSLVAATVENEEDIVREMNDLFAILQKSRS